MINIIKASIFVLTWIVLSPCISSGYTSPNVPLGHWSYEAMERLAASGIVHTVMLNKRPLSRMEMAEMLAMVPETTSISSPILTGDIMRLTEEYRGELTRLGIQKGDGRHVWYRLADPIGWEVIYAGIGDLNRTPRENYWGEYFNDGITNRISFRSWANLKEDIVIAISPKFMIHRDDYDLTLQESYIKTSLRYVDIEIGKDSIWWGPGYHGSLILSNNARPFNLIEIGSHRPFPLPGWFRVLGLWDISAFLTRLEDDRDFPGAKLAGLRLGLLPAKFMEISLTRGIIFGGEGKPGLDIPDYLKVFFAIGENEPGKLNNDQLAGLDFRLSIPAGPVGEGLSLYGQLIGEDEAGGLPSSPSILGGVFLCDLFRLGLFDIRVEYADQPLEGGDSPRYAHGVYGTGYTYHRRVIAYPMGFEDDYFTDGVFNGIDAWDIFIRTTIHIRKDIEAGLEYDYEHHLVSSTVNEIKESGAIDITWKMLDNMTLKVGQEYERIDNWRGIEGQGMDSYYLWGKVELFR